MIQIKAVVAYSHDGRTRAIEFEPGKVNIISGDSRTGKSSVLDIVNYCFGSKSCNVPEGKVRRRVSWFGLLLQTGKGQAFVARRVPLNDAKSSEAVYFMTGARLEVPPASELRQVTNRDGLRALLASWVGISDYLHEPPSGQSRAPLLATIRHAVALCFQSQNEIAQRDYLFHGSNDRDVAQALKDTLPYFLGAVSDDYVAMQQELKKIRIDVRTIERQLTESAAIRGDGLSRADTLLAEARASGLIENRDETTWQEKIEILRKIQVTPVPSAIAEAGDDPEYRRLTAERSELVAVQRSLMSTVERAKTFEGTSRGFSAEAREHTSRLEAVSVFEVSDEEGHACPLCQQQLPIDSIAPSIEDLRGAQEYIGERNGVVESATPRIESAIQEVEIKLKDIQRRLEANRELLSSIKRSNQRLQLAGDVESKRALVLGRISLYVENVPDTPDTKAQELSLALLRSRESDLEKALGDEIVQQRLESCISNVNRYLSEYARKIELEFSDAPLRLDIRNLTIVADTPERPVPMSAMGSGENHVGYHVVAHLAMHTWFARRRRPVPSFLLFDQISQAHFSPDRPANTRTSRKKLDADRRAVKRLYGLIFDVVESLNGKLQVLITDHPDFTDDPRFQKSLRERWRDGTHLIPLDWPLVA